MKILLLSLLLSSGSVFASDENAATTEKIWKEILVHGHAYADLVELSKIGPRLGGSDNAAKAVEWGKQKMERDGFDKVWLQPVMVDKWVRGKTERATVTKGSHVVNLRITALGGSIDTGKNGVKANVVEVHSLDEVKALGDKVKGKIVFYNRPMDPSFANTFQAYGEAGDQRFEGPALAAKQGAAAAIVRSMTLNLDNHPHTGATSFKDGSRIPCAAISTLDAEKLSAMLKQTPDLKLKLELSAKMIGKVQSFNVIGEITGSEKPEEIIDVGGHLDSWDLAQGSNDDGAGITQSIEILRAIKALNLKPKRTLRAVLFMSEENGSFGGKEYAKVAKEKGEKHIAAIESDNGSASPRGFGVQENERALERIRKWVKYLDPIYAGDVREGHGGTDIDPLGALGAVRIGLNSDSQRYFDYHHAETDRIETISPRELHLGSAAMAILTWMLSEQGI